VHASNAPVAAGNSLFHGHIRPNRRTCANRPVHEARGAVILLPAVMDRVMRGVRGDRGWFCERDNFGMMEVAKARRELHRRFEARPVDDMGSIPEGGPCGEGVANRRPRATVMERTNKPIASGQHDGRKREG
jgi:hypothetical protein